MSMSKPEAYVSLATNDNYAIGALALGQSLRNTGTTRKLALIISDSVTLQMRHKLSLFWDSLVVLEELNSHDIDRLALLERPDLGVTFTKINAWKLEEYSKCVFLDADTLVLVNVDELFERDELSAAPDCGWPDCFNSGVFVFVPSMQTFQNLVGLAQQTGSFDGGDQGLLNTYWSQWATSDIKYHLPFVYNMTANFGYTYKPAFRRFGKEAKIVHFIGAVKPWHSGAESASFDFLGAWKAVYADAIRPFSSPPSSNMIHPVCPAVAHAAVQFAPVPHLPSHLHPLPHRRLRSPPPPVRTVTGLGEEGASGVGGASEVGGTSEASGIVPFASCTLDEETRRRNFEQGRIDYAGADRFDLLIQPHLDAHMVPQDETETLSGVGSEDVMSDIAVASSEDFALVDQEQLLGSGADLYRAAVLVQDDVDSETSADVKY